MACVLVVKYDKIIDTDRNVKKNNGWTGLSRLLKKNKLFYMSRLPNM